MADTTSLDLLNQTQIELLQKYDGALNRFNEINNYFEDGKAIEAINALKLDGFEASQNPSSEQIPVLNTSGQLQLPLNQPPILIGDQDLMSRTFYVDAENGDDSNDGTEGAPFATLKKAIDSVPVGGFGDIYLLNDYILFEIITITNKALHLRLNGHTLTVASYVDSSLNYNCYYGLRLRKASIAIGCGTMVFQGKADSTLGWLIGAWGAFLKGEHPGGVNFIRIGFVTLNMPSDAGLLCATGIGNWAVITHLLFENCTIVRDGGYVYTIQGGGAGVGSLSVENTSIHDSSGNAVTWSDVVTGIIKDANSVPRNIISNIIF